jgi:ectoine hydroxylase-related dioxygenase (phytanoyl-CoA dioxygenase family)
MNDKLCESTQDYKLHKDGFCIIKNVFDEQQIEKIKNQCINNDYYNVKHYLLNDENLHNKVMSSIENNKGNNNNYVFQDYIWIIKKSSVHTCHRDNNGDFFNEGQKYPSYTMLIFLEDMDKCLGVIPSSHKNINSYNINLNNSVMNLLCNKGDVILFNANLIHVGALNKNPNNLRIQMKITHKDDLQILSYYENYNKVLDKNNDLPFYLKKIQKNISCMFPGISNLTQSENIKTSRGTVNGANIGLSQKIFSYLFYGNSNFYDLPNAF